MTARSGFLRSLDQGFWSLASLVVTVQMARAAGTDELAAFAFSSVVAILCIVVVRSLAVYAPMVAGARSGVLPADSQSQRRSLVLSAGGAGVAFVLAYAGALNSAPDLALELALAAGLQVFTDWPRQVLIASGRIGFPAVQSLVLLAGVSSLFLTSPSPSLVVGAWMASLLLQFVLGSAYARSATQWSARPIRDLRSYAWRQALESLTMGLAAQAALLLLFVFESSASSAGFRLAGTLVFAPAFTVIQSLQPLLMRHVATLKVAGQGMSRLALYAWQASIASIYLLVGGVAYGLAASDINVPGLQLTEPFLLPVGLASASALAYDVAITSARMSLSPAAALRLKVIPAIVDVSGQAIGLMLGGLDGLILALLAASLLRLAGAAALVEIFAGKRGKA